MKVRFNDIINFSEKIFQLSNHPQHKMCCIITNKKDKLLSIGFNQFKTHPQQYYSSQYSNPNKIFLHAEIHAIINLNRFEIPKNIYILRLRRDKTLGLALPCENCYSSIITSTPTIKSIFYTNKQGVLTKLN